MRFYLHALLIAAIVLAGISPACAFISGKSELIEICTAKGIEYKQLPGEQPPAPHDKKQADCAFCFAQAHGKSLQASSLIISRLPPVFETASIACTQSSAQQAFYNPHAARAPPILT